MRITETTLVSSFQELRFLTRNRLANCESSRSSKCRLAETLALRSLVILRQPNRFIVIHSHLWSRLEDHEPFSRGPHKMLRVVVVPLMKGQYKLSQICRSTYCLEYHIRLQGPEKNTIYARTFPKIGIPGGGKMATDSIFEPMIHSVQVFGCKHELLVPLPSKFYRLASSCKFSRRLIRSVVGAEGE